MIDLPRTTIGPPAGAQHLVAMRIAKWQRVVLSDIVLFFGRFVRALTCAPDEISLVVVIGPTRVGAGQI